MTADNVRSVIPNPLYLNGLDGVLCYHNLPSIQHDEAARTAATYLQGELQRMFNVADAPILKLLSGQSPEPQSIQLQIQPDWSSARQFRCSDEAYQLVANQQQGVVIRAAAPAGAFYGAVTLLQLLQKQGQDLRLPCVEVLDAPSFPWRGVLLDVGRHFFSVPFIKRVLDAMATYKLNRFHWHLTEDQGWRLEVRALPRLTQVGSVRARDTEREHGGYYTQEQVREVVAYAAARHILVVPEMELPGHCGAALASYPHLSCTGAVTEVPASWGIYADVYCAGKEEVFTFLETVLCEMLELFPGPYIHIGGDECPKSRWEACPACQLRMEEEGLADEGELQSWFIQRISKFLASKGRRIIGWDEILEGGLAPGATVMSWRGTLGGVIAARSGHDVIMTPTSHCYFDYRQAPNANEPGAWYACLPLEVAYAFNPVATAGGGPATSSGPASSGAQPTADPAPAVGTPVQLATGAAALSSDAAAEASPAAVAAPPPAAAAPGAGGVTPESSSMDVEASRPCGSTSMSTAAPSTTAAAAAGGGRGEAATAESRPAEGPAAAAAAAAAVAGVCSPGGSSMARSSNSSGSQQEQQQQQLEAGSSEQLALTHSPSVEGMDIGSGDEAGSTAMEVSACNSAVGLAMQGSSPTAAAAAGSGGGGGNTAAPAAAAAAAAAAANHLEAESPVRPPPPPGAPQGALVAAAAAAVEPAPPTPGSPPRSPSPPAAGAAVAGSGGSPVRLAPMAQLTADAAARVLGGQANLWTEYVEDEPTAEYMLLPRLCAMAEALWTPVERKDWLDFRSRLPPHLERLGAAGWRYRPLDPL